MNIDAAKKVISILEELSKIKEDDALRVRVASAIVYRHKLISIGTNKLKTDPFQKRFSRNNNKIYIHAEIEAIKKASKILTKKEFKHSSIYVCRLKWNSTHKNKKLIFGMSKPCDSCMNAIIEFGIKKIIYTTNNGIEILER
jgi:tRNA(Arg) A34 adenosine deaminase TadA